MNEVVIAPHALKHGVSPEGKEAPMKVMSEKEIKERFGIASEQLDAWEKDATEGILHGEPRGAVVMGRPPMFGGPMKQVGFKEPLPRIAAIDKRAEQLGMSRSDYLRSLVDEDLRAAGIA